LKLKIQFKACEDCGGSGICSECNGEGFVLRKRSGESSEMARVQAKKYANRFTAGYYFHTSLFLKYLFFLFSHSTRLIIPGFQRSGAIVLNALLVDPVQAVVAVES